MPHGPMNRAALSGVLSGIPYSACAMAPGVSTCSGRCGAFGEQYPSPTANHRAVRPVACDVCGPQSTGQIWDQSKFTHE